MGNHYHLFIQTPEANLSAGMTALPRQRPTKRRQPLCRATPQRGNRLQNTFTRRFNVRHRKWGRVFGDRYKAVLVEGTPAHHCSTLLDYIHLNPVRAKLIRPERGQSILDFPWSSVAGSYALPPGRRAAWLAAGAGLTTLELEDTAAGRRHFVERLDRRAVLEERARCGVPVMEADRDARCSHLRRGWYWGTQAFREKMLHTFRPAGAKTRSRACARTPERRAHGLQQAEEWLRQGQAAAGLTPADLPAMKGTSPVKVVLAALVWRHTSVPQTWLAEKLHLSSAANASQLLRGTAPARA
jgi:hypothetical protein